MNAPTPTPRDMEAVRKLIDGTPDDLAAELAYRPPDGYLKSLTDAAVACRIELGKERFRSDLAKERADDREAMYAQWLANACEDRDRQTRRARRWKVCSWALFLLLVAAITWGLPR